MKTSQLFLGITFASVLALTGCDQGGQKAAGGNDNQKKREAIMKDYGNASKTIGSMLKDPATFNAGGVKEATAKLSQDPWALFTADSKGGRSKDEVWSKADDFKAEVTKYQSAVSELNKVAGTGTNGDGVKAQFEAVGASCKSCHEKFRKPE